MVMLSSKHYIDDHIDTCVTLERRVCAFDKFKGQYQQQFRAFISAIEYRFVNQKE